MPTEAATDGWNSHDSSFFSRVSRFDLNLSAVNKSGRFIYLIHPLTEFYKRQEKASKNFRAPLLSLALSEKFLGALMWDTFYRIVVASLACQTLKSRHDKIFKDLRGIWFKTVTPAPPVDLFRMAYF